MRALFLYDHFILKAQALNRYYKRPTIPPPTTTTAILQPYYKTKTMLQGNHDDTNRYNDDTKRYDNQHVGRQTKTRRNL
jgi:hypothetical protein